MHLQLTEADYRDAQFLHGRLSEDRLAILVIGSIIILGIGIFLLFGPYSSRALRPLGAALACAVPGGWIGYLVARFALMPSRLHRNFEQHKALQRGYDISWDEDYFVVEGDNEFARTPWSDFVKWKEDEKMILLYITNRMFRLVPKRMFSDSESVARFRKLASEKIRGA